MWAKIEITPSRERVTGLPANLDLDMVKSPHLVFGSKLIRTRVEYYAADDENKGESYDRPIVIRISSKLKEKMLIPDNLVYRVRFYKKKIILGPIIGLLLGTHNHVYNPRHMSKYSDRFGIYNRVGGLIYAFSPKSVDWRGKIVYGLYYNIGKSAWEYGRFPLPDVIYRRDFHSDESVIKKLRRATGNRLFNSYRFTKIELYKYIEKNSTLNSYLPPTELVTGYSQVKDFIDLHIKIILKPVDLSRGRGICVIEKKGTMYEVTDYRSKNPADMTLDSGQLESFFAANKDLLNKYLIQKYIYLAQIDGALFDTRVVMQKINKAQWQCTGIECRVAARDSHLTNISKGGYALHLNEALGKAFPGDNQIDDLARQIIEFSRDFCIHMDKMDHHFAEFGMDIAVDRDKKLWLIEANVFPSFKGFKRIDYPTYLAIRYTPLTYALSLTELKDDEE